MRTGCAWRPCACCPWTGPACPGRAPSPSTARALTCASGRRFWGPMARATTTASSARAPRCVPGDGRVQLDIGTSLPGLQVLHRPPPHRQPGPHGRNFPAFAGFAIEPQYWPDSPNHPVGLPPWCGLARSRRITSSTASRRPPHESSERMAHHPDARHAHRLPGPAAAQRRRHPRALRAALHRRAGDQ